MLHNINIYLLPVRIGTLLILGGISLNLAIVGSLFRPASFYTRTTTAKLLEANALVPHGVGDNSDTEVTYVQKEATEEVRLQT